MTRNEYDDYLSACERSCDESEFVRYEVYQAPDKPTDDGKFMGATPNLHQAISAARNAGKIGKIYFVKGLRIDGTSAYIT